VLKQKKNITEISQTCLTFSLLFKLYFRFPFPDAQGFGSLIWLTVNVRHIFTFPLPWHADMAINLFVNLFKLSARQLCK